MRLLPSSSSRRAPAVPGRRPRWQRRWLRHRRLVAALLAGVVVWSLSTALRPPTPSTISVVVARRDLVPGMALSNDDVDLALVPAASAPPDAVTSFDPVVGRAVASVVRAGETIRDRDVVSVALLSGLGPGLVASAVRLSDAAATALVRPGDVIDILAASAADATGDTNAVVIASRVRVLAVPTSSSTAGPFDPGDASGSASGGGVVVLATTSEQALALAGAAVGARLSLVLRGA